ncbi:DEAD/DEAH box helicase [Corynebacterium casei]|uniref:DEAD/DEAH box helicase n=1 Tax=Corynebacterium casei TaxID=160386 RepID=UPI003F9DE3BA
MSLPITFDENLIEELSSKFDLRYPNRDALKALVLKVESGEYDPRDPLVIDMATGVGKTYVLASFIEYLRRQGVNNVMVVTPRTIVQDKTVQDLTNGSPRYVGGFDVAPIVVTPQNMHRMIGDHDDILLSKAEASTVYVFNVQQLFPPKESGGKVSSTVEAMSRKVYRYQEETGVLSERLIALEDLVIIADESHMFGDGAEVFRASLTNLKPALTVGLTASPDATDDVVFKYPLWRAIQDGFVKAPVLVYRKSGYSTEERQLQDAVSLLRHKDEQYRYFRESHPDLKQTKPLLFVVCSDINHANRTTDYLRNTYFSESEALGPTILQVDSNHEDAATLSALRNIDQVNSAIRCIVSVNKLREGWDTKRIAVMCTLRAMGSEVLTQQVMGRGLRLPFGSLTGYSSIDQLDIISHKSFVGLLKSENILREFGIEEDFPGEVDLDDPTSNQQHRGSKEPHELGNGNSRSAGLSENCNGTQNEKDDCSTENESRSHDPAQGNSSKSKLSLKARRLGDDDPMVPEHEESKVEVHKNQRFKETSFLFPSSSMTETQRSFDLADVEMTGVRAAARTVRDLDEHLERREINPDGAKGVIDARQLERFSVESFHQTALAVQSELVSRVLRTRGIQVSSQNVAQLKRAIIPEFMKSTAIEQWTEKSKESAVHALTLLITNEVKKASRQNRLVEVEVHPVTLPVQQSFVLPAGEHIEPLIYPDDASSKAKAGFVARRFYGPWEKGLFNAAAFDSYSTEYKLAFLFNFDPNVEWWTRIYPSNNARIAYTTRDNYIPDFVVLDSEGTHWIIEGKAEDQREDKTVINKRKATEKVLRMLIGHQDYQDQSWGYLIAFERDISRADSLQDLIAFGDVERMPKL